MGRGRGGRGAGWGLRTRGEDTGVEGAGTAASRDGCFTLSSLSSYYSFRHYEVDFLLVRVFLLSSGARWKCGDAAAGILYSKNFPVNGLSCVRDGAGRRFYRALCLAFGCRKNGYREIGSTCVFC